RAGGLGLIGAGYNDAAAIHSEFERAGSEKIGIGFITWYASQHAEQMEAALAHNPAVVMLSFGDARKYADRIKSHGIPLIVQVQTIAMAREAAALGADVIVAQGNDGGGHGAEYRGTFSLVPSVVDAVSPVPVLAAGGIADGRGVAAALMLGASGALIGTRFFASNEAIGSAKAKEALTRGNGDDTVRTSVFDIVRGYHWPTNFTGRALVNAFTKRWHGCEDGLAKVLETETPAYWEANRAGDIDTAVVWASQAVDLITSIEPAEVLLRRLVENANDLLGQGHNAVHR
ncbi:MAG: nitronate monooxygenase, partial [Burkholderiaceae bacterium]